MRDGKAAVPYALRAVQGVKDPRLRSDYLDTLAAAYAAVGDFPSASATQKKSLAQDKNTGFKKAKEQRLRLYQEQKTFTQSPDARL